MGSKYLSLEGLFMTPLNANTGLAYSVNGPQSNSYDQNDSALPANAQHAGGIFRSRATEDLQHSLAVGARAASPVLPAHNYMNPPLGGSGTDNPSAVRFTIGSDDESSDDDASPLSSLSSGPGSEPGGLMGLEQTLESLLLVKEADSAEGAVGGCVYGGGELILEESLTSSLNELASLFSAGKGGKDKAVESVRKELGQTIADSFTTARLEELHTIACRLESWQKTNCRLLEKCKVNPFDTYIPDLNTRGMVPIKFDDLINGMVNTGVMSGLGEGLDKIDSYLGGCDVTMLRHRHRLCTDMSKEVHKPILSFSFYQENLLDSQSPDLLFDGEELPDFTYLLDGDKNKDWNHLARELDAYFQPVFQALVEVGGAIPEDTLEEYFKSVVD
ncbi:hypothetical protein [Salinisphaera sp. G21_0]|uniref:hypothetical protein n=1 Tax=Salinisphaera sp. G21_0 TaxID=2821094 RepID=UPI001ADC9F8D|nr:hypothetical protein [Salinisphaera sp. G21_0]MBO9483364.1 hypothetical protein [Salinisphaera sp. G21_0]